MLISKYSKHLNILTVLNHEQVCISQKNYCLIICINQGFTQNQIFNSHTFFW